jgi:hypothetical protein
MASRGAGTGREARVPLPQNGIVTLGIVHPGFSVVPPRASGTGSGMT